MSLTAKVNYCKRPEIRYITFQEDVCTNYEYVKQKISKIFQIGDNDYSTLKLLWKDKEEDLITISSDEELMDAIANRSGDILKLYIKIKNGDNAADGSSSSDDDDEDWLMMHPPFIPPFGGGRRKFCKKGQKKMCKFMRKAFKYGDPRMFMGCPPPPPPPHCQEEHNEQEGEEGKEHKDLPPYGPPPPYIPSHCGGMRGGGVSRPPFGPPFDGCRGGGRGRGFRCFPQSHGSNGDSTEVKKDDHESNQQSTSDKCEQKKCAGSPKAADLSSEFMNDCMIVDMDSALAASLQFDGLPILSASSSSSSASNCCGMTVEDERVEKTLATMQAMGFSNEGGWLKILLKEKNCDINEVLNTIKIRSKPTSKKD